MTFSSVIRHLLRSPLTAELDSKLDAARSLHLAGINRLGKALVSSTLAQKQSRSLLVVTGTLEEAGRWATLLEAMGWVSHAFYPTSDALPYELRPLESETVWAQMQVLAELMRLRTGKEEAPPIAIVATDRALQPHLPPLERLAATCLTLRVGEEMPLDRVAQVLARLGYDRVATVETEGQWSRRGDILDIFPVSSELPVRLDWFGDNIEKLREFDPATQRALDPIEAIALTPTRFEVVFGSNAPTAPDDEFDGDRERQALHPESAASLLDYLPDKTLMAIDEVDLCRAHSDRWVEAAASLFSSWPGDRPLHRDFESCLAAIFDRFPTLFLTELAEEKRGLNLASRPIPAVPHQFGSLARTLRDYRDSGYTITLVSAQPSRAVALLQEHDCAAQFVPNPRDYPAIEKLHGARTPVALKYSGLAEIQGFVLPTFRLAIVSDREFFGQHALGSPTYVRRRRRAISTQVDPNKLSPGDYVVHRNHGVGKFLRLEGLTLGGETREYLVVQYEDGLLRVAADQVGSLSRYRATADGAAPKLNKMTGKAWANTTNRVRKALRKLAIDLLDLYAQRSQQVGTAFPPDTPWQREMEESFPYQPTPDQLKATQDVKLDMESPRPMDRLVCGDVGFGKTEVAIRAIFKAVMAGKQVALLAPTTILAQQHYHTLQERFAPYPVNVALLNRFKSASERRDILSRAAKGELDIVVGTHQLLSKEMHFKDLGLLVVDEEQRFGVAQKEKIKALKTDVDVLTLSATPIPRTLYMALSGVREMSTITTPPPSRRAIATHLSRYDPEAVRSAIRRELDRGGQVFYVVPRIEGIETVAAQIREMVPTARLAIAHGQMGEGELESTMLAFCNGEADVLVCTTIVESGLDIPRVNTILIEDAHRFGLSQLYQLRGRVGRAGVQAHAWLFYPADGKLTDTARQRLRAIQEFTHLGSGYQLAMRDMEIRGAGNLLGAEQSGHMDVVGFDLYMEMLQEAIAEARGSTIPTVEDTQIDLAVTAFIPASYIPDPDRKMSAYRAIASTTSRHELGLILEEWQDCYGPLPHPAQQLARVVELKQIARRLGIVRIRPEGKQNVLLETKIEESAWKLLQPQLQEHLRTRFVFQPGKITVRGLGAIAPDKQLQSLIEWLEDLQPPETRARDC